MWLNKTGPNGSGLAPGCARYSASWTRPSKSNVNRSSGRCAGASCGVRQVRFHDLRHTFGTRMAGAGVALRTLQEWMGHRDFKTTLIYADYQPSAAEADLVEQAFGQGAKLSESGGNPDDTKRLKQAKTEVS